VRELGGTFGRLVRIAVLRAVVVMLGFAATLAVATAAFAAQDVALDVHGAGPGLTISGGVSGVAPGARASLHLTLANAATTPAHVSTVTAVTSGVSGAPASCAAYLSVADWHGTVAVPAHGRATVDLAVAVSAEMTDACAGATWDLRYTAY
jgi:hypothetical protein